MNTELVDRIFEIVNTTIDEIIQEVLEDTFPVGSIKHDFDVETITLPNNQEISGKEFNDLLQGHKCYKLLNRYLRHKDYKYSEGLNEDVKGYEKGYGLHFFVDFQLKDFWFKTEDMFYWISEVTLEDTSRVVIEDGKVRTDRLRVRKLEELYTCPSFINMCLNLVKRKKISYLLSYVPEEYLTESMCEEVIKLNPYMISNIPDRFKTAELRMISSMEIQKREYYDKKLREMSKKK